MKSIEKSSYVKVDYLSAFKKKNYDYFMNIICIISPCQIIINWMTRLLNVFK